MPLKTNIPVIYADRFLASFCVFAPILVPFYESNGLNADQVFMIQAIFSGAMLFLEIPTGYLADVVGRRGVMIMSGILFPLGITVYIGSHHLFGFALAEIVFALAISLRSGTDSALLYDTLLMLDREPEHKRIAGNGAFLESLGHASASIIGGLLAHVSLLLPFIVNIVTASLLLPVALLFKEPKRECRPSQHPPLREIWNVFRHYAHHAGIRQLILFSALINGINPAGYGCISFTMASLA